MNVKHTFLCGSNTRMGFVNFSISEIDDVVYLFTIAYKTENMITFKTDKVLAFTQYLTYDESIKTFDQYKKYDELDRKYAFLLELSEYDESHKKIMYFIENEFTPKLEKKIFVTVNFTNEYFEKGVQYKLVRRTNQDLLLIDMFGEERTVSLSDVEISVI